MSYIVLERFPNLELVRTEDGYVKTWEVLKDAINEATQLQDGIVIDYKSDVRTVMLLITDMLVIERRLKRVNPELYDEDFVERLQLLVDKYNVE